MSVHYNVQIHVQRVDVTEYSGTGRREDRRERNVTEVLDVKVTEATEAQAYEKARRILDVTIGSAG